MILSLAGLLGHGLLTAAPADFHPPGYLLEQGQTPRKVELMAIENQTLRYREAGNVHTLSLNAGTTVFECEPSEYSKAMELYQARSYSEAMAKFAAVKKEFLPLESLDDSHASLAAFHELECLRKTGDLARLATALQHFPKGRLTRDSQRRQLELYVFWDAVRTKDWTRLDGLAKERANVRLPGDQRAQVAYCHGLALEGLGKPDDALMEFNTALTADSGASEDIARRAALRILGIYQRDPAVRAALKSKGSEKDGASSEGRRRLAAAMAVAGLFEKSLGAGVALPTEFKEFRRPAPKPPGG